MSAASTTGLSIADLKALIKRDLEISNELQTRLDQLREDIKAGKRPGTKKIDLMEVSNKDMTKDLVLRIEQIESSKMDATDREMLQALNARLAVCDLQASRLAELRELEREVRGETHEFLEAEPVLRRSESAPVGNQDPGDGLENAENPKDVHQHHSDDEVQYHSENEDVAHQDRSGWQIPYRVLGIPPDTSDEDMTGLVTEAMSSLAIKHDPERLPNDPQAPQRWTVIEKSRDVLTHVERRRFMDTRGRLPNELKDIDLDQLRLG